MKSYRNALSYAVALAAMLAPEATSQVVASFSASTTNMTAGTMVMFTDTSTGSPLVFAWDFDGDGITDSLLQYPNYTYAVHGVYQCSLTVTNATSMDTTSVEMNVDAVAQYPFSFTESRAATTRGYWFMTPVAFTVTGLRVPDETGHGLQNVALTRFIGSTTGVLVYDTLFESFGQPSNQVMPCLASYSPGDSLWVQGGCGDATMLHMSMSTTGGPSTVNGQPISIHRASWRANIVAQPPSTGHVNGLRINSSPTPTYGRVYMLVSDAAGIDYGDSSSAGLGNGAPELTTTALPILGRRAEFTITTHDRSAIACSLVIGLGRTALPTPFGTINVGLILLDLPVPGFAGAGTYQVQVQIPSTPSLVGGPTNFQVVTIDPSAPKFLGMSNGTEWFIGTH